MRDQFQNGQILDGRFRTLAPLNHGSFGMVFLAEDLLTKQEVAIKCLTKPSADYDDLSISADEGADEKRCHDILKHHPHLVNLVHHFETAAHTYLVLEYCQQGDLYEAIRLERGPLETEHVRKFMLQLISAVEHMHRNGYYHRDIKPENIFITADGDMKLGDFGLSTQSIWSFESCVGSDRYMAPEQYEHGGNGYSPAHADIWSIGVCLLNILFARNPFVTPTESDVLFADYVRDPKSLYDIFPNMSDDTFHILSIALAIDPMRRSLSAVRSALQQAITFTIDDDDLDDFCTESRDVVRASANREPLRTPSVASPQLGDDSFPWSSVLHTTSPPKPTTRMPVIPDDYEEDLFSDKAYAESWYSGRFNTPSTTTSGFGASFQSMHIPAHRQRNTSIPSSLPVQRTRPLSTMASIFGKKDSVAKSWSDMWEEDEEEEEREAEYRARRELNARSFSHESVKEAEQPEPTKIVAVLHPADVNLPVQPYRTPRKVASHSKLQESLWQPKTPKRTTPLSIDKWSELGNRRRNPTPRDTPLTVTKKRSTTMTSTTRKRNGSTAQQQQPQQENQPWNRRQSRNKSNKSRPAYLNQDWRSHKVIDSSEDEDHDWVGGWHNFHL